MAGCLILVAVVLVLNIFDLRDRLDPDLAARVGKSKITKDEVNKVSKAGETDYDKALDLMIETKKYVEFGQKEGVKLSQNDIDTEAVSRFGEAGVSSSPNLKRPSRLDTNPYSKYLVENAVWKKTLEAHAKGTASGAYFNFPFTRFWPTDLPYAKSSITGTAADLESDKQYAKSKAEETRAKVEKGADIIAIIDDLAKDPRLSQLNSANGSMKFSQADFDLAAGSVGVIDIREAIFNFGQPGLTPVIEQKRPKTFGSAALEREEPEALNAEKVTIGYYFVKIDSLVVPKGSQWLDDGLAKVKVRRNAR